MSDPLDKVKSKPKILLVKWQRCPCRHYAATSARMRLKRQGYDTLAQALFRGSDRPVRFRLHSDRCLGSRADYTLSALQHILGFSHHLLRTFRTVWRENRNCGCSVSALHPAPYPD